MSGASPTTWQLGKLGDLARVYSGGTPSRAIPAYWGGDIAWVTTAEVDGGYVSGARETITEAGINASAARIARPGTLLLAMYGQGKTRGKAAMLQISAAMNQACAAIEVGNKLDAQYLLHFLASQYDEIRSMSNAGSQENLSGELVRRIPVAVPPIQEQRAIAGVLGDADDMISKLERMIAKKQAIKQGMIQQLLTGKTRLPGFSDSWRQSTLGGHATGLRGARLSKDAVDAYGEYPCVLYGELFTTYGRRIDLVRSRTNSDGGVRSQAGDVLVPGSTTTVARDLATASAIHSAGVLLGGDTNVVRPGPELDPDWLAHYITHRLGDRIAEIAQGLTIKHLYVRDLLECPIVLPSIDEQQAIVTALSDAEAEISLLKLRLKKARDVKQGMMQELLTGRTRLPVEETAG